MLALLWISCRSAVWLLFVFETCSHTHTRLMALHTIHVFLSRSHILFTLCRDMPTQFQLMMNSYVLLTWMLCLRCSCPCIVFPDLSFVHSRTLLCLWQYVLLRVMCTSTYVNLPSLSFGFSRSSNLVPFPLRLVPLGVRFQKGSGESVRCKCSLSYLHTHGLALPYLNVANYRTTHRPKVQIQSATCFGSDINRPMLIPSEVCEDCSV